MEFLGTFQPLFLWATRLPRTRSAPCCGTRSGLSLAHRHFLFRLDPSAAATALGGFDLSGGHHLELPASFFRFARNLVQQARGPSRIRNAALEPRAFAFVREHAAHVQLFRDDVPEGLGHPRGELFIKIVALTAPFGVQLAYPGVRSAKPRVHGKALERSRVLLGPPGRIYCQRNSGDQFLLLTRRGLIRSSSWRWKARVRQRNPQRSSKHSCRTSMSCLDSLTPSVHKLRRFFLGKKA